jgi:hypothetical protein
LEALLDINFLEIPILHVQTYHRDTEQARSFIGPKHERNPLTLMSCSGRPGRLIDFGHRYFKVVSDYSEVRLLLAPRRRLPLIEPPLGGRWFVAFPPERACRVVSDLKTRLQFAGSVDAGFASRYSG